MWANRGDWRIDEGGCTFTPNREQVGRQYGLGDIARNWTVLWLFNRATGWRPGPPPANYPYSRPLHAIFRIGSSASPGELVLNPAFLEWLMGWPIGWTDPTRPATGFARWLQRSRGALSELATRAAEEASE
jgi:hypothetical protein